MDTDVLTVREVAEKLRLSEQTIRAMVERGEIKATKFGGKRNMMRILQSEVERILSREET